MGWGKCVLMLGLPDIVRGGPHDVLIPDLFTEISGSYVHEQEFSLEIYSI